MSRRDEIETLLPFYLNGTLSGDDLDAVEEWLATDPAARLHLRRPRPSSPGPLHRTRQSVRRPTR